MDRESRRVDGGFVVLRRRRPPRTTLFPARRSADLRRTNGVLVSDRGGEVIPYALDGLQDRGVFFTAPGTPVYEGMIVGENNRVEDLALNVCRTKKLTNMRAAGRDDNVKIAPPRIMSLEENLEYIEDDELLEVTPSSLRLRKRTLNEGERKRERKKVRSAT